MNYEERLKAFKIALIYEGITMITLAEEWDVSTVAIYDVLKQHMMSSRLRALITARFPTITFEDDAA